MSRVPFWLANVQLLYWIQERLRTNCLSKPWKLTNEYKLPSCIPQLHVESLGCLDTGTLLSRACLRVEQSGPGEPSWLVTLGIRRRARPIKDHALCDRDNMADTDWRCPLHSPR
jgi:hypothetical protein